MSWAKKMEIEHTKQDRRDDYYKYGYLDADWEASLEGDGIYVGPARESAYAVFYNYVYMGISGCENSYTKCELYSNCLNASMKITDTPLKCSNCAGIITARYYEEWCSRKLCSTCWLMRSSHNTLLRDIPHRKSVILNTYTNEELEKCPDIIEDIRFMERMEVQTGKVYRLRRNQRNARAVLTLLNHRSKLRLPHDLIRTLKGYLY